MARSYQYIRTKYWENAQKAKLSSDAILLELYLVTNRNCGMSGAQQISIEGISHYTGLAFKKVNVCLKELTQRGRIIKFSGGWILVSGKWSNEASKSKKMITGLKAELDTVPNELRDTFSILYPSLEIEPHQCPTDTLSIPNALEVEVEREEEVEEEGKGDKSPAPPDLRFLEMVSELFPDMKSGDVKIGAETLADIERLDGKNMDDIMPALRWAAHDETSFWNGVNFSNCKTLRIKKLGDGTPKKYENIVTAYNSKDKRSDGRGFKGFS